MKTKPARAAATAPIPPYEAQLATLVSAPPAGDDWLHEQKFDGYRIGCRIERASVELWSRRSQDWTDAFPGVAAAARALRVRSALIDGEAAVLLPNGVTSFHALQKRDPATVVTYFAFDLLHLDGQDLRALPLEARKEKLRALVARGADGGVIRYSDHVIGNGAEVRARACAMGLEGIVSKRRDAPYRGKRNMDWQKTKCLLRQELVIGGFTDPEGSREGIGALLVGYYDGAGRLLWAGKVGTGEGWTATFLRGLRRRLRPLETAACPFAEVPDAEARREGHWVRPDLVAEVAFAEWTPDHRVRHASFQGLREDKPAREVVREG